MPRLSRFLLSALAVVAAAFSHAELPAGLYLYQGNDGGNYRPADEPDAIPFPRSPSFHAERKVCIPADSQAWLQEQISRLTTGLYPQGRFEERQTGHSWVYTLLNPAQAKPGLDAYTVSMVLKEDPQGRPAVAFSINSTDTERNSVHNTQVNQRYTFQGPSCPAEADSK
ncbi:hypothetical protein A7P98_05730 [Eikenella sp. NML080894]|uniref:hypothetical protein n=1 Tax=Eikenella TaxID=538 RepID=UPI0007E226B1|nr:MULTISPECIES: hypothetical protein [Eikenella]OAM36059.1 hypothetical protein A7P98_05730 [Eikenella sp. NML080894]OAM38039.1 hypothetical protein A7P99_06630 [Eikenella sp. NML120348]OAM45546.1 hypothetical protein A7Q03_03890 [Eikenella sp. NML99-0057]